MGGTRRIARVVVVCTLTCAASAVPAYAQDGGGLGNLVGQAVQQVAGALPQVPLPQPGQQPAPAAPAPAEPAPTPPARPRRPRAVPVRTRRPPAAPPEATSGRRPALRAAPAPLPADAGASGGNAQPTPCPLRSRAFLFGLPARSAGRFGGPEHGRPGRVRPAGAAARTGRGGEDAAGGHAGALFGRGGDARGRRAGASGEGVRERRFGEWRARRRRRRAATREPRLLRPAIPVRSPQPTRW